MKIRTGFVSNSSSTSYTVAFVPEDTNLNLKTFDFLLGANGNQISPVKLEVFRDTVGNRKTTLENELKTILRDKEWLLERINKLVECSQIPAVQLLMNELDEDFHSEYIRYARRQSKKEKWSEIIVKHIARYKEFIKEIDNKTSEIEHQLSLIKALPDDTMVAKWEEDCGGYHMLSDLLKMLEPDGRVIILEKVTT